MKIKWFQWYFLDQLEAYEQLELNNEEASESYKHLDRVWAVMRLIGKKLGVISCKGIVNWVWQQSIR